jgi:phosphoglycerate-specific signal transduction histidine kinase
VLMDIEDVLPYRELPNQRQQQLQDIYERSRKLLKELNGRLSEFFSLSSDSSEPKGKRDTLHNAWKRLKWDQKDIDGYRES